MSLLIPLVLVGLVAAALLGLAASQRRLIYPGAYEAALRQVSPRVPAGTEPVAIGTADGERLFGLWRAPEPGCAVVLSFHGNASRPDAHAKRFLEAPWAAQGWGVLAIAYRGYPGSTGRPSETGLIADGEAAYREVARRAPGAGILLHGHSLGAAVAVAVGESRPHLGLYLEAPFDSLAHLVRLLVPFAPGWLLRDTFRSDLRIAGASAPVLIVHGTKDPVIPLKLARKLAEAAGPAARLSVLTGDHVSILGTLDIEAERRFRPAARAGCATATQAGAR
ncbi:alpha/beta hydrolase [Methylobacterium iners]|uniref:Alpha/beta hydrolase n=1 Tax=Methylobacterium iners TaxID=418707 RepID=A0ABQ4RRF0_9HYPH|nr:alpha/beta hydrolase [Methylobacterium iners]GJD93294.1 hypothetical protein OCOJLMKI_0485 [Methylobacterium iners]